MAQSNITLYVVVFNLDRKKVINQQTFKFAVRSKPDLLPMVQSILQGYKRGITCNFKGLQQAHNLIKRNVTKGSLTDSWII